MFQKYCKKINVFKNFKNIKFKNLILIKNKILIFIQIFRKLLKEISKESYIISFKV